MTILKPLRYLGRFLLTNTRTTRAAVLIIAALLSGCAGPKVDWTARIGNYTYDQAVVELGPPDKQAKLQDGTTVADWLTQHGYTYSYPAYGGGTLFWYGGPPYSTYSQTAPDRFLRLTFGPDGRLQRWTKLSR